MDQPESEADLKPRQRRKRETRARLADAARRLFAERGFERTTVRAIASAGGAPTGAVAAHFGSKIGLLLAILEDVNRRQLDLVRQTMPPDGCTRQKLMHMLRIFYAFDLEQPALTAAVLAYAWRWDEEVEERIRAFFDEGDTLMRSLLAEGVRAGELAPALDLDLAVRTIFALYTRTLRNAIVEHASAEEAAGQLERQVTLLFDGLRHAG